MYWVPFTDNKGRTWTVHQIGLHLLVREHLHASMMLARSKVVREKKWIGPDLVYVETNFNGLRAAKDREAPEIYQRMAHLMLEDGENAMSQLVHMRKETLDLSENLRKLQRKTSNELMNNIERSVERGERAVATAKFVRDMSATTLVVGAGFMSGGAAFAVLGGGSMLKGTATYQDSGNVGAAMIDTVGTFVVGAIAVGAAANQAGVNAYRMSSAWGQATNQTLRQTVTANAREKGAVIVVGASFNSMFEFGKGAVQGQEMTHALKGAAMRFGTDLLGAGVLGPVLDKVALPVAVRMVTDPLINTGADKAVNWASSPPDAVKKLTPKVKTMVDLTTEGDADGRYIQKHVLKPYKG